MSTDQAQAAVPSPWWAVARSEEVTGQKPLAVDIGGQAVVLWRDKQDVARALEDRCPHRRAPLSLGCVRDNGWIQCGYHGWSYDGETGRLKEIPNLKDQQKFPPLYRAIAFGVYETGGFVRVNLDAKTPPPRVSAKTYRLNGTAHIGVDHQNYLDALFDDPGLVVDIKGVRFTPYLMSELVVQDGMLTMERSCEWASKIWPAPFSSDFLLTILSRTHPETGETDLILRDSDLAELLRVHLSPVPAARGVTAVRWRAELGERSPPLPHSLSWGAEPFSARSSVDAAALRVLKPSVSLRSGELRAVLKSQTPAQVA